MNEGHMGSDFDDFLQEEGLLEEVEAMAAQRVLAAGSGEGGDGKSRERRRHRLRREREEIDRLLEELRSRAEELLQKYGVRTTPPQPKAEELVWMRALTERKFPGPGGRPSVLKVGETFKTDAATARRNEASGVAEIVGPAPSRKAPVARPLMESGVDLFREWSNDLAGGATPAVWQEWEIDIPEEQWPKLISALSYASRVKTLEIEVAMAMEVTCRAGREALSDRQVGLLVGAISQLLLLLVGIEPEYIVEGLDRLDHLKRIAKRSKYRRGIQAAVNEVYKPGMTEEECWQSLKAVHEESFSVDDAQYEFFLDCKGELVTAACQRHERTGRGTCIQRGSFRRYFQRARDAAKSS